MTEDQWKRFEDDIIGLWGRGSERENQRRASAWRQRWFSQSFVLMSEAVAELQRQHDHWPGPASVWSVIKRIEERDARKMPTKVDYEPEGPISPAEYREIIERLCEAAAGANDRRWQDYLYQLADFYDDNRQRVEHGEPRTWPPPTIGGFFGQALARSVDGMSELGNNEHQQRRAADDAVDNS